MMQTRRSVCNGKGAAHVSSLIIQEMQRAYNNGDVDCNSTVLLAS